MLNCNRIFSPTNLNISDRYQIFANETYLKIRNLKSIELNKNAIPERFVGVVTKLEKKK